VYEVIGFEGQRGVASVSFCWLWIGVQEGLTSCDICKLRRRVALALQRRRRTIDISYKSRAWWGSMSILLLLK